MSVADAPGAISVRIIIAGCRSMRTSGSTAHTRRPLAFVTVTVPRYPALLDDPLDRPITHAFSEAAAQSAKDAAPRK